MNNTQTISFLNDYPKEKYNVLIPVTTISALSGLQKVIINTVQIDTSMDKNNKSKDIYYEKSSEKYALTKIGLMKLAAAANISVVESRSVQPDVCTKCIEMAKAIGKAQACGSCPHAHDVKFTVKIRVPEPSGGFRIIEDSKEIDCVIEKESSTSDAQYKRWLPHRASIAETKAFNRCIRTALTLASGYTLEELQKPFIIAHIVPNLDAPEVKNLIAGSYLRSAGFLFEMPDQRPLELSEPENNIIAGNALPPPSPEEISEGIGGAYENEGDGEVPFGDELPWDDSDIDLIICTGCGQEITETKGRNGQIWTPEAIQGFSEKKFGQCLCTSCQQNASKGGNK